MLLTLGADRGALDASRLLRLPGTTNSKSGVKAAFLHIDLDGATAFEDLATAVLPVARRVLRERRQDQAAPTLGVGAKARRSASGWIRTILGDIHRLIAYRWNGHVPEGSRNTTLFVYGTFLARVTGVSGFAEALRTFAGRVCDLGDAEIDQIVGSITRKFGEDGRGYRFTTANAAAALAITREEVRLAGLRRLWPADAELDAALKAAKRRRDRQYQRQRRQAAGARPREQSLARTQPWRTLGISRASYYRRRVHQQSAGEDVISSETNSSITTGGGSPGGMSEAPEARVPEDRFSRRCTGQEPTPIGFDPPVDGVCETEVAETDAERRPGREPVELA